MVPLVAVTRVWFKIYKIKKNVDAWKNKKLKIGVILIGGHGGYSQGYSSGYNGGYSSG